MRQSRRLLRTVVVILLVSATMSLILLAWRLVSAYAALLVAGMVGFTALLLVSVVVLPARLVARDTEGALLEAEQRASAVNSARSTLVQGLVGLAALAGIFVAWQQFQIDREQSRTDRAQLTEQIAIARQGQAAERFVRAVDELGNDQLEQRLGGIYGLERVAEESSSTRLQVFDVLTAYVRQRARPDPPTPGRVVINGTIRELGVRVPDVQAVLTVLGRRRVLPGDPKLDLSFTDLRHADLSGAQLQGANLFGARLQQANLDYAQLQGADLTAADLRTATLRNAHIQRANLINANLEWASFRNAQLQRANLRGAGLRGAWLMSAQLQGANLTDAEVKRARDDAKTVWPHGFHREAHDITRVP
jgi:hypothetical protein